MGQVLTKLATFKENHTVKVIDFTQSYFWQKH